VEQLLSEGGLGVVVGWVLAQITDWVKAKRERSIRQDDRQHAKLEREDAFQRDNLLRLQEAVGELSVAVGRFLQAPPSERSALGLEAKGWGRKCHMLASRVTDDRLRTASLDLSNRLGESLVAAPSDSPLTRGAYTDAVASLTALVEEMGARLRGSASLARADASITAAIVVEGATLRRS
jgi:hypothetical protein